MQDRFRSETNTLGTPYRNARATAMAMASALAAGKAPLVEPLGLALTIQLDVQSWQLDALELGERAALVIDGYVCDALNACETCQHGNSHS